MDSTQSIYAYFIAVLLGFLIGLDRERKREDSGSIFAGIRTFPLIALFGTVIGQLSQITSIWLIPTALISFGSLLLLAYWRSSAGESVGGTTEVTALVAFALGVFAGLNEFVVALAGAVIVTAVLSLKDELRILSGSITRADLFAIVQFAAVSLVILPIVPNENLGPWGVWNPRTIWLLVVLISGISFIGYLLSKVIRMERSIGLSGLIGGIASSTAVTLSFSERSKSNEGLSMTFAVGVLVATAVSIGRLMALIGVVNRDLLMTVLPSLLSYSLICALGSWIIHRFSQRRQIEGAKLSNPFELKTAFTFALLFAAILLITKAAEVYLGNQGLYIASALSGFTQLDAITLSIARQSNTGLVSNVALQALTIALAANSLFKASLTFSLGTKSFAKTVTAVLVPAALASLAFAWFIKL